MKNTNTKNTNKKNDEAKAKERFVATGTGMTFIPPKKKNK